MGVGGLVERAEVGVDDHVSVSLACDGVDGVGEPFDAILTRRVLDERRLVERECFVSRKRLDLAGEELRDGPEELALVAVMLVGSEIEQRVWARQDGLQRRCGIVDRLTCGLQLGGDIARKVEFAANLRVTVEVVVVVIPDDPVGVDVVVGRQRVGKHVVPAELTLGNPVEASGLLIVDYLVSVLLVGGSNRLALVAADQIALLVAFQIR